MLKICQDFGVSYPITYVQCYLVSLWILYISGLDTLEDREIYELYHHTI